MEGKKTQLKNIRNNSFNNTEYIVIWNESKTTNFFQKIKLHDIKNPTYKFLYLKKVK